MLQMLVYDKSAKCQILSDKESIESVIQKKEHFFWLDIEKPTSEEMEFLEFSFNFHPLAIEDCMINIQRPKIDRYIGYLFTVLHAASLAAHKDKATSLEVDSFISEKYLVTVHLKPIKAISSEIERCIKNPHIMSQGSGYLFYNIANNMADNYFPILDKIDKDIEHIEELMIKEHTTLKVDKILSMKKAVMTLRRFIGPQIEIMNLLARCEHEPIIKNDLQIYFKDIVDLLVQISDTLESYSEGISNLLQGYAFVASNKLNEVMKLLTVITTIVMPMTLVTGIYGMNFQHIPELRWEYGYYFTLFLMLIIGIGMLLFFRHRKWL